MEIKSKTKNWLKNSKDKLKNSKKRKMNWKKITNWKIILEKVSKTKFRIIKKSLQLCVINLFCLKLRAKQKPVQLNITLRKLHKIHIGKNWNSAFFSKSLTIQERSHQNWQNVSKINSSPSKINSQDFRTNSCKNQSW